MLIHVPRLYTKEEFMEICLTVPEDYDEKSEEFWCYVEEKLNPLSKRVRKVYHELLDRGGEEGMKVLSTCLDERSYRIVKKLVGDGAELQATEDPLLVSEASSWLEMMGSNPNLGVIRDLYNENLRERDGYISRIVDQTLKDGEVGVIFLEPTHKLILPEDVKVVKMCRFDPGDYLNVWLQKLRLMGAGGTRGGS